MSDKTPEPTNRLEDSGTIGLLRRDVQPLRVAPTTAAEFNTFSLDLVPVACLSLHDITFGFDSSFVAPEAAVVLAELPVLREQRRSKTGQLPLVGIFGHADPTGDDAYNKALSGRRARSIFGLLRRDPALWVGLHGSPFLGDNWQTQGVARRMREFLGDKRQRPLKDVIADYMSKVFPFKLEAADFLAQGKDKDGKGDYQGCSEFNPLIVLSKPETDTMSKEDRNRENRPNRRVVIYLFRPGVKVRPALWPCPRWNEPPTVCKTRFFIRPPGDVRRQAGAERREHEKLEGTREDTFACRFYDRVSHLSPCERPKNSFDFHYALQMTGDLPWSMDAELTIAREDGKQTRTFLMEEGERSGDFLVFLFRDSRPGMLYRGHIKDGDIVIELFPLSDLFRIQEKKDPLNILPVVDPEQFDDSPDPEDGAADGPSPEPEDAEAILGGPATGTPGA